MLHSLTLLGQWICVVLERDLGHKSSVLLHCIVHGHQASVGQPHGVSARNLRRVEGKDGSMTIFKVIIHGDRFNRYLISHSLIFPLRSDRFSCRPIDKWKLERFTRITIFAQLIVVGGCCRWLEVYQLQLQ